jgi:hypothetical protein
MTCKMQRAARQHKVLSKNNYSTNCSTKYLYISNIACSCYVKAEYFEDVKLCRNIDVAEHVTNAQTIEILLAMQRRLSS